MEEEEEGGGLKNKKNKKRRKASSPSCRVVPAESSFGFLEFFGLFLGGYFESFLVLH